MTPIPASSPLEGPIWSVVVPILVFAVTLAATALLYRRFNRRH